MKLVLIAVAIFGVCGAAPAAADMSFSQRSPRNIVSYSAVRPGLWARVPDTSGAQVAYGQAMGTPRQIICVFLADDRPTPLPFSNQSGWTYALKERFQRNMRNNPQKTFRWLMKRFSNVTIEGSFVTASTDDMAFTVIFSYDEIGIVEGQTFTLRALGYQTQTMTRFAAINTSCVTPRKAYDAKQDRILRQIRDSVTVRKLN